MLFRSKVKTKTKEMLGGFKKVKASMTAETADPSKPPPKKMNINLFKKSRSVGATDNESEKDGGHISSKSANRLPFWKRDNDEYVVQCQCRIISTFLYDFLSHNTDWIGLSLII